jgi:putative peptidoglycan lipid II flippase
VLAAAFGAGNEMDAFFVAFRIPTIVRDLFAEGAMSAAFVPTFTRHLAIDGKATAWRLANNLLNVLLVTTLALVVVAAIFARPIVSAYAGDYAAVPGKLELTITLTRVLLPFLTMLAVAAVWMGMLNSLHYYFIPSLSPAMFNVALILGVFMLVPVMPALGLPRILGVAIAALVGGLGQIALQWPALRREGFRYAAVCDPRDESLRTVLLLMGPGTLGLAATQVNIFVNTVLATSQGTGAVSWLNYAFRLMYFPIGLFGVSIGTALLPQVSRQIAVGERAQVRDTTVRALTMMLMLTVPATVGLMVLARPIVALLFEHGQFVASDTDRTASALRLYAIGLVGYSATRIVTPVFYALRQSRIAVLASTLTIALNVVLSLMLVHLLGFTGLALATSIAAVAHGSVLLVLLRKQLAGLDERRLAWLFMKITVAALVMGASAWGIQSTFPVGGPSSPLVLRAVHLGAAIAVALVVLAVSARSLRIDAFDDAVETVKARLTQ